MNIKFSKKVHEAIKHKNNMTLKNLFEGGGLGTRCAGKRYTFSFDHDP